jgi:hypothetical protein
MSDAPDYLIEHAKVATMTARRMRPGYQRNQMRRIARIYHLMAKQGAYLTNAEFLDDYRIARDAERKLTEEAKRWLF